MRPAFLLLLLLAGDAAAQSRFVERTPPYRVPVEHTMQRAGEPLHVARFAAPSVTRFDSAGYVGGNRDGTFGTDFTGLPLPFRRRPGRIFRIPSANPSAGQSIARGYRTDR